MTDGRRRSGEIAILASDPEDRAVVDRLLASSRSGRGGPGASSRGVRARLIRDSTHMKRVASRDLVVLTDPRTADAIDLPPELKGRARYVVFVGGEACEVATSLLMRLGVRSRDRFVLADAAEAPRRTDAFVTRLLAGLAAEGDDPEAEDRRILTAFVDDDTLHVRSARFDVLTVPLERIVAEVGGRAADWRTFELDPHGQFLYWPARDAHLGWRHLTSIVDPVASVRSRQEAEDFNRRYGAAIRARRRGAGLRQSDVPGLSPRNLGRIERGEIRATSKALGRLAAAHGRTLSEYLADLAAELPHAGTIRGGE